MISSILWLSDKINLVQRMNSHVVVIDLSIGTKAFFISQHHLISIPSIPILTMGTIELGILIIATIRAHTRLLRIFRTLSFLFLNDLRYNIRKCTLLLNYNWGFTWFSVFCVIFFENALLRNLLFTLSFAHQHAEGGADSLACEFMRLTRWYKAPSRGISSYNALGFARLRFYALVEGGVRKQHLTTLKSPSFWR